MSEHVTFENDAADVGAAVDLAKANAKAQGRRVRTLVGVKGQPGAWSITLALDEIPAPVEKAAER